MYVNGCMLCDSELEMCYLSSNLDLICLLCVSFLFCWFIPATFILFVCSFVVFVQPVLLLRCEPGLTAFVCLYISSIKLLHSGRNLPERNGFLERPPLM